MLVGREFINLFIQFGVTLSLSIFGGILAHSFCTLLGFLIVIKPIRESHVFVMMRFNALDRPDDRPHTLKWIVLGDVVPGVEVLALFCAGVGDNHFNGDFGATNGYNLCSVRYARVGEPALATTMPLGAKPRVKQHLAVQMRTG